MAPAISAGASAPCTRTGRITTLLKGYRLPKIRSMSMIAAPAPEELSPAAKRFLAFARQTLRTDPEAAELGKEQA